MNDGAHKSEMLTPGVELNPQTRIAGLVVAVVLAVGLAVRMAGAMGELWLDELWAIDIAAKVDSPFKVLTELRIENHCLYTMYLNVIGGEWADWVYRLPALIAGGATIVLGAMIGFEMGGRPNSRTNRWVAACLAAVMIAGSHMLIHFDSEARGYSPAVACALLAMFALLRGDHDRRARWIVVYGCAFAAAVMWHPVALHVLAAGGVWTLISRWRAEGGPDAGIREALRWHGAPAGFFVLFYLAYLRKLQSGGATPLDPVDVVAETVAYTLGMPLGWSPGAMFLVAMVLFGAGLFMLARRGDDLAAFFFIGVFLSPLALTVARDSTYLFARYFTLNAAFMLLLISLLLARIASGSMPWRVIVALVLAAFLAGSAVHTSRLMMYGRSQYVAMLWDMYHNTPGEHVSLSSDFDFRNTGSLTHYSHLIPPDKQLAYYQREVRPAEGTRWRIEHEPAIPPPAPPFTVDPYTGVRYRLFKVYPYSGLSGWNLLLYENAQMIPPLESNAVIDNE